MLVTENAHAHYALQKKTKVADVKMDGGSKKTEMFRGRNRTACGASRVKDVPFGNK